MLKSVEWNGSTSNPDYIGYGEGSLQDLDRLIPGCQNVMINMRTDSSGNTVSPRYSQEAQYRAAFDMAHAHGYSIIARMKTRSFWTNPPSDLNVFMASYADAVEYWAALCEEYNVEYFIIGNEFRMPAEAMDAAWYNIINKVRAVYTGQITYLTNWWMNPTEFNQQKNIGWYNSLDFLAISAFNILMPNSTAPIPNVDQLVERWRNSVWAYPGHDLVAEYEEWASTYGKQVLLISGLQSGTRATWQPFLYVSGLPVNKQEQANWYDAFFRVFFDRPWVFGVTWDGAWHHRKREGDSSNNNGFDTNNKPAQNLLALWYSSGITVLLNYNSLPISVNATINGQSVPSGSSIGFVEGSIVNITFPKEVEV